MRLSSGSTSLALLVIQWHCDAPTTERLRRCWVLITLAAQEASDRLPARVPEVDCVMDFHPVLLPTPTTEATYQTVDDISDPARTEQKLESHQIVIDLTGGIKSMTAGMVLMPALWPPA